MGRTAAAGGLMGGAVVVLWIESAAGGVRRHVAAPRLWRDETGMWSAAAVDQRRRQGGRGNTNRVGRL